PSGPRPGWTDLPAGLSTTMRRSSSHAMASGVCPRCGSAGPGGGRRTRSTRPPASPSRASAGQQPTSDTYPSSKRPHAGAHGRPRSRAMATSRRSPGRSAMAWWMVSAAVFFAHALARRAALVQQEERADDNQADDDGGVSHVELRIAGKVDEVRDLTEAQAVQQVAGRAAELETEREAQEAVLQGREHVVEHDGRDGEERRHDQEELLALQDAERRPGVRDVGELDQPVLVRPRFPDRQVAAHHGLGELVEHEDAEGDAKEGQVALHTPGQGARRGSLLYTDLACRH